MIDIRLENGDNSFRFAIFSDKGKEEMTVYCQDRNLNLIEGLTHEIIEAHITSIIRRFTGSYGGSSWIKGFRVPHIVTVLGSEPYKKMLREYNCVETECGMKLVK